MKYTSIFKYHIVVMGLIIDQAAVFSIEDLLASSSNADPNLSSLEYMPKKVIALFGLPVDTIVDKGKLVSPDRWKSACKWGPGEVEKSASKMDPP